MSKLARQISNTAGLLLALLPLAPFLAFASAAEAAVLF